MGNREESRSLALLGCLIVMFILLTMCLASFAEAQTREEIRNVIRESAFTKGIDPSLAVAIAEVESNLNTKAVGKLGEIGVYQLRPEFHPKASADLHVNVEVALDYLVVLKAKCSDYGDAYFVCFNTGPYRKYRHPTLSAYYKKVMSKKSAIAGRYP